MDIILNLFDTQLMVWFGLVWFMVFNATIVQSHGGVIRYSIDENWKLNLKFHQFSLSFVILRSLPKSVYVDR